MPPQPQWRQELEGYIRRHEADQYAHASMRHELRNEFVGEGNLLDGRLTVLERWQQRMIGGMAFGALLIGGGGVAAVVELLRK